MHPVAKILLGLIIIAVGFGLFIDSFYDNRWTGVGIDWWGNAVTLVTGAIPILLVLFGLFVVWLEADELKAEKELQSEPVEAVTKMAVEEAPAKKAVKRKTARRKR